MYEIFRYQIFQIVRVKNISQKERLSASSKTSISSSKTSSSSSSSSSSSTTKKSSSTSEKQDEGMFKKKVTILNFLVCSSY